MKGAPWLTALGAATFVAVVATLQQWQPGYDPLHQHMSELALGPHGWAMLPAFAGLALAAGGCAAAVRGSGAGLPVSLLIAAGGAAFLGAGLFPLGAASELHIALVAAAFVSLTLATYLLPGAPGSRFPRPLSWGLGGWIALCVALADRLPAGLAQRLAAAGLLLWLIWAAFAAGGRRPRE